MDAEVNNLDNIVFVIREQYCRTVVLILNRTVVKVGLIIRHAEDK